MDVTRGQNANNQKIDPISYSSINPNVGGSGVLINVT